MKSTKTCDECAHNCVLVHGQRKDPSPLVISFIKVLYGDYEFSKILYLPPEVSRKISAMGAQCNYDLEDSNGQRWTVTVASINNSWALDKGWNKFYTDHGLGEGYILAFHYIVGSHFVVQMYGRSGCQKLNFPEACSYQRNISKTKGKFCAKDGKCQSSSHDLTSKRGSGKAVLSGSQNGSQILPVTQDNNSGNVIYASENGSQSQPTTIDNCLSLGHRNGTHQIALAPACDMEQLCMINRDATYKCEDYKSCLYDLSNFEMQSTTVDSDGSNVNPSNKAMVKAQSSLVILKENPDSTEAMGFELPAGVAAFTNIPCDYETSGMEEEACIDKDSHIGHPSSLLLRKSAVKNEEKRINSAMTPKIVKRSEAVCGNKRSREDPKIFYEVGLSSLCRPNKGKDPKVFNELSQSSGRSGKGNTLKVSKKEPLEMNKMSSCKTMDSGKDPKVFNELGQSPSRSTKVNTLKMCKKEPPELNKMSSCKVMDYGKAPKLFNELGRNASRAEKYYNENLEVVKKELDYASNTYPLDTSNNSCLAVIGSQALMELPECLPSISLQRASVKVVYLKGPDTRTWPVLYQEKYGLKYLTSGLEGFSRSNNLRPGDECVFRLENGAESIYTVDIVRK